MLKNRIRMRSKQIASILTAFSGSPSWTRTNDNAVNSRVLYRLSYWGIFNWQMILYCTWWKNAIPFLKKLKIFLRKYENCALQTEKFVIECRQLNEVSLIRCRDIGKIVFWRFIMPCLFLCGQGFFLRKIFCGKAALLSDTRSSKNIWERLLW